MKCCGSAAAEKRGQQDGICEKDQRAAQAAWAKAEQTLGSARQALIEALVGMIRTGGTGSFNIISDKDRIFFAGLMLSASPVATAEELAAEAEKVRAMRKRLQAAEVQRL